MDPKLITPMLMVAFVAWAMYRRVRRNIGRQPLKRGRMTFRVGLFGVIGVMSLAAYAHNPQMAGALLAGLVGGGALAWLGLRHTKFETTPQGTFYTPHTYIGLLVSVLLLARLAYRFVIVYPAMQVAHQASANPFAAYQKSPLTLAIFGLVIGYYVAYYAGVLVRGAGTKAKAQ